MVQTTTIQKQHTGADTNKAPTPRLRLSLATS